MGWAGFVVIYCGAVSLSIAGRLIRWLICVLAGRLGRVRLGLGLAAGLPWRSWAVRQPATRGQTDERYIASLPTSRPTTAQPAAQSCPAFLGQTCQEQHQDGKQPPSRHQAANQAKRGQHQPAQRNPIPTTPTSRCTQNNQKADMKLPTTASRAAIRKWFQEAAGRQLARRVPKFDDSAAGCLSLLNRLQRCGGGAPTNQVCMSSQFHHFAVQVTRLSFQSCWPDPLADQQPPRIAPLQSVCSLSHVMALGSAGGGMRLGQLQQRRWQLGQRRRRLERLRGRAGGRLQTGRQAQVRGRLQRPEHGSNCLHRPSLRG